MPSSLNSPISSSPMIDEVMKRKKLVAISQNKLKWALLNLLAAFIVFLEANSVSFHIVDQESYWRTPLSYFETFIFVIFLTNGLFDLYQHFFPFGLPSGGKYVSEMTLSPLQMKLLSVKNSDFGFKAATPSKPKDSAKHPYGFSSPLDGSFLSPQSKCVSFESSSWIYKSPSNYNPGSPNELESPKEQLIKPDVQGTFTDASALKDYLKEFELKEKEADMSNISSFNISGNWNDSTQRSKTSIQDQSAILRKVAYQLSTPMPVSTDLHLLESPTGSSNNKMTNKSGENCTKSETLCRKLGIDPLDLVFWNQNLRIWMSKTILGRISSQIDKMNSKLMKVGLSDSLIGNVGVERLKKCAALPQLQSIALELNDLISFLNVTIHQEYLVQRLKELANSGAISEFNWNGGGRFKGNEWSDKLPTDSEILMSFFAAYMDSSMPSNYRNMTAHDNSLGSSHFVEDKPFTGIYYVKLPDVAPKKDQIPEKINRSIIPPELVSSPGDQRSRRLSRAHKAQETQTSKRSIVILQTAQRPPHFVLQLDGKDKLEISPGRHNLFHTLLFFLHHIKTKESGMLGRINLGASGINILWVIDEAK